MTRPLNATKNSEQKTTAAKTSGSAINLNSASLQELEKLPGIGRGIAQRIVEHRRQYGAFRRPEHLMMVRGISEQKFRELQPMIVAE